jgi:hypothetical protein
VLDWLVFWLMRDAPWRGRRHHLDRQLRGFC